MPAPADLDLVVLLEPTAMAAGGDAIARDADGRVVFVEGALPGERVRARVVQAKKDFARAVVVEVVSASPDRVAVPEGTTCGGCTWSHVAREAQGPLKASIVSDALRRIARLGAEAEAPPLLVRPAPEPALRTSARLGVTADGRAGERRRGSHEVLVGPTNCPTVHPLLADLVAEGRFHGAEEVTLRVGVASGERAAAGVPSSSGFVVPGDVAVGTGAVVHESVGDAWLQVSIGSFFQSGPVAAASLVAAVAEAVGDALPVGGHLVDAYAGVGLFGATVGAARSARITSIESDPVANADARVNLADLDAVVLQGEVGRWRPVPGDPAVDVVVADPARSGLGRPGVDALSGSGAARLVLVSCDPASFARDVRLLDEAGYRLGSMAVVDAFPDTFHVETVSRFDRV